MPRTGPRREAVKVKLSDDEKTAIDRQADVEGVLWAGRPNTSAMIRILCARALDLPTPTQGGQQ